MNISLKKGKRLELIRAMKRLQEELLMKLVTFIFDSLGSYFSRQSGASRSTDWSTSETTSSRYSLLQSSFLLISYHSSKCYQSSSMKLVIFYFDSTWSYFIRQSDLNGSDDVDGHNNLVILDLGF